jgi:hypothetical protein
MAFEQLETEAFWHALAPDLAFQPGPEATGPMLHPNAATATEMLGILDREGYIQLPNSQDPAQIGRLAKLVAAINAADLPAVFAFVYEPMWQPFRRIGPVLDCLLGGQHAFMPDLWAWFVDPTKGEAGWRPHRDRRTALYPDLRPKALTVWIPLTQATLLNSCMYVVPKHGDPDYGDPAAGPFRGDLAAIRALPAPPGHTLIWTQSLLHWGARTSEMATTPRMSMSMEFQRADEPPFSGLLLGPEYRMTLRRKLALIGLAIVKYKDFAPLDGELTTAAERWVDWIPELFGMEQESPPTP